MKSSHSEFAAIVAYEQKTCFHCIYSPQKGTPKQDGFRHVPVRMESCRGLGILNIGIEFPGCLSLTFDSLDSPFLQVGQLHLFLGTHETRHFFVESPSVRQMS